jgi:6-phosphogluconolactonase
VPPKGVKAVGVRPDPMPAEAPVDRVSLTATAIAEARTTMLVISGEDKQQLLEKAVEDGAKSTYPVGRVIDAVTVPVDIYCLTV